MSQSGKAFDDAALQIAWVLLDRRLENLQSFPITHSDEQKVVQYISNVADCPLVVVDAAQVDVYDGTAEFLRKLDLDEDALTKAIIGTIGDIDSYQLPDAKGYTAFLRHILGVTDEERQQRREQILGTTLKDFRCHY